MSRVLTFADFRVYGGVWQCRWCKDWAECIADIEHDPDCRVFDPDPSDGQALAAEDCLGMTAPAQPPRALDLFCRAGGVSEGLLRAGFDVVGVDILDCSKAYNSGPGNPERHERPAIFVRADALEYPIEGFDFVWASPPCQAHSVLRKLFPDKEYPDMIPATRERLIASGIPYCIENVHGAPLGGFLIQLCGTMFGLQTTDGRAELRRHRLFETSWPIALRPACQHGGGALTVAGHAVEVSEPGWHRKGASSSRRAISITGHTAQTNLERNVLRETFSTNDARHAMGIDWMTMKDLSQAIPPAYAEWIGTQALLHLGQ